MFMRKDNLESVKELEVDTTPVKVYWHTKINQAGLSLCRGHAHRMSWLTLTGRL